MNDCEKVNWKHFTMRPSAETFRLMKECSHKYPFEPDKRRFGEYPKPFFYHYKDHENDKALAMKDAAEWRRLGYNARIVKTKDRGYWGTSRGTTRHRWSKGTEHYHVWVGEKEKRGRKT